MGGAALVGPEPSHIDRPGSPSITCWLSSTPPDTTAIRGDPALEAPGLGDVVETGNPAIEELNGEKQLGGEPKFRELEPAGWVASTN